MKPPPGKYRIGAFKDFMPDWARFLTLLLTVLVFQLSGAVYPANLGEMVGATALTAEDVRLLLSASLVGMTMAFPLLFRIKFRFMSRTTLLTCGAVMIVGSLITMRSTYMPLLLVTSFVMGFFRMVATFECNSSIQLVITPKRDLSVFFCFIYLLVLGSIQWSGIVSAHLADWQEWRRMHVAIILAHVAVVLWLSVTLQPFRIVKKMPLYQIDWLGLSLWSALLLSLNFVFEYGVRLDWLDSPQIRAALVASLALGAGVVFRMFTAKRPFIAPATFGYKNLLVALVLFASLEFLTSTMHVVMPGFIEGVLQYNVLHSTSLNWAVLAGIVGGVAGSYYWLVIYRGGYKTIVFCSFLCLVLAHLLLYQTIAPSIPKENLFLPYALRGAGHVALYISLTVYTAEGVPFRHFMQGVALLGVVHTAVGATIANSICAQTLEHLSKIHRMTLGQELDHANVTAAVLQQNLALGAAAGGQNLEEARVAATSMLYGRLNLQAMLVSWKELLGWWALAGGVMLIGILMYHYAKPGTKHLPTMQQMAVYINPFPRLARRIRIATRP